MQRRRFIVLLLVFGLLIGKSFSGERAFSWTHAPAKGDNIAVNFNAYNLGKYLNECQVNRPEIVAEVKDLLRAGKHYRKKTRDQKGRATTLTVYVDKDYMLRIVTYRNDVCPDCNGTGHRSAPFAKLTSKVDVNFGCLECKGTGELKNNTTEKYYVLSPEDFENPEEGRRLFQQRSYANAPSGANVWVERLASPDPRQRLEACLWLDQNYVKKGTFFQDIMPMLKKARYYDSNEKKRIMVWQFWAGKDMPQERNRAYYRIYADTKSGKITEKGFYSGN